MTEVRRTSPDTRANEEEPPHHQEYLHRNPAVVIEPGDDPRRHRAHGLRDRAIDGKVMQHDQLRGDHPDRIEPEHPTVCHHAPAPG